MSAVCFFLQPPPQFTLTLTHLTGIWMNKITAKISCTHKKREVGNPPLPSQRYFCGGGEYQPRLVAMAHSVQKKCVISGTDLALSWAKVGDRRCQTSQRGLAGTWQIIFWIFIGGYKYLFLAEQIFGWSKPIFLDHIWYSLIGNCLKFLLLILQTL